MDNKMKLLFAAPQAPFTGTAWATMTTDASSCLPAPHYISTPPIPEGVTHKMDVPLPPEAASPAASSHHLRSLHPHHQHCPESPHRRPRGGAPPVALLPGSEPVPAGASLLPKPALPMPPAWRPPRRPAALPLRALTRALTSEACRVVGNRGRYPTNVTQMDYTLPWPSLSAVP